MTRRALNRATAAGLLAGRLGEEVTVRRWAAGARNEYGEFEEGAVSAQATRAVAAPLGAGHERAISLAGLRIEDAVLLYFAAGDAPRPADGDRRGDLVEYRGREYRALSAADWGGCAEVVAVREDA